MSRKHPVVIGCGTGRSGTVSLAKLLARCRNFHCTHEMRPLLPWVVNEKLYVQRRNRFRGFGMGVGDVHSVYLPYLDRFLTDMPRLRIVCARRDVDEVVTSFEKKIGNKHHWYDHQGDGWSVDPTWDPTFPTYDIADRHEAIARYATEYGERIDALQQAHPDNVLVVATNDLGTRATQKQIFEFAGIGRRDRMYVDGNRAHLNKTRR